MVKRVYSFTGDSKSLSEITQKALSAEVTLQLVEISPQGSLIIKATKGKLNGRIDFFDQTMAIELGFSRYTFIILNIFVAALIICGILSLFVHAGIAGTCFFFALAFYWLINNEPRKGIKNLVKRISAHLIL